MPEFFPLAALRDPVAFLAGARIPLVPRAGDGRWECVNGTIYQNIAGSLEAAEEYDEATDQTMPSRAALATLALDLADPDVARWCDRKIGEVVAARYGNYCAPVIGAVLGCDRRDWVVTTLHSDGYTHPFGFYREESRALGALTVTPPNSPIARALLLHALFGKGTP